MNIDTGTAAVIIAVLIFYLRLIILQRESARQARQPAPKTTKKSRKAGNPAAPKAAGISILSKSRIDLAIAGAGLLAALVGMLAYAKIIQMPALQTYWWLPTSLGILAFGTAFKLPK